MSIDDLHDPPEGMEYWKKELEGISGGISTPKPMYGTELLRTLNTEEVKFLKDMLLIILPKAEEKDYVKICRIVTKLDDMLP